MDQATELKVAGHVGSAREKLAASKALARDGFHADTVSRAYYSIHHAAMAVPASIGLAPRSHDGVRTLFGARFVQPGRVAKETAKSLRFLHDERENGDYGTGIDWDAQDAQAAIARAEEFLKESLRVLQEDTGRGW